MGTYRIAVDFDAGGHYVELRDARGALPRFVYVNRVVWIDNLYDHDEGISVVVRSPDGRRLRDIELGPRFDDGTAVA